MTSQTPTPQDERQPSAPDTETVKTTGPTFAASEDHVSDLSGEIVKILPRLRGERITCRRIVGNHYRCNWWRPQIATDGSRITALPSTTMRVSKSQFLHVTGTADRLSITPSENS